MEPINTSWRSKTSTLAHLEISTYIFHLNKVVYDSKKKTTDLKKVSLVSSVFFLLLVIEAAVYVHEGALFPWHSLIRFYSVVGGKRHKQSLNYCSGEVSYWSAEALIVELWETVILCISAYASVR